MKRLSKHKSNIYQLPNLLITKVNPAIIIFVLAIGIYSNTVFHDFTQDDAIVIYENIYVQQGVDGLKNIFGKDSFSGFFDGENKSSLVSGGRYRPMTIAFFAVVNEVFSSDPMPYHICNILIYGLLCLLFYKVLVTAQNSWSNEKLLFFSFLAALVFTTHPIHTEVVANVKGLDEIFSLLFGILAYFFTAKFLKSKNWLYLIGASSALFIALLSKESAAPFVVLIPLAAYYFNSARLKHALSLGCMLSVIFLLYWLLRTSIVGSDFGAPSTEMMNNPFIKLVDNNYVSFSPSEKWASITMGLGKYIQLLFFPHPLTHDYYPRHFEVVNLSNIKVIAAAIMNIALIVIAILGIRKKSFISFCIFMFYATIFLTSNIPFPIGTHVSERFLFIPSIGFSMALAYLITEVRAHKTFRFYSSVAIVLILFLFVGKTVSRNTVWKNDFTLFTTDVHTSKNSAKVRNAAGGALLTESRKITDEILKTQMVEEAIVHLREAVRIHPNYKEAHLLAGNAHTYNKQYSLAINSYDRAIQINPYFDEAIDNLKVVLIEAAKEEGAVKQNFDQAIQYLQRVLALEPQNFQALSLMGTAHGSAGSHWKAIDYFNQAIAVNPNVATTYVNLGVAQLNAGLEEDAQINFHKAVEIDPSAMRQIQNGN